MKEKRRKYSLIFILGEAIILGVAYIATAISFATAKFDCGILGTCGVHLFIGFAVFVIGSFVFIWVLLSLSSNSDATKKIPTPPNETSAQVNTLPTPSIKLQTEIRWIASLFLLLPFPELATLPYRYPAVLIYYPFAVLFSTFLFWLASSLSGNVHTHMAVFVRAGTMLGVCARVWRKPLSRSGCAG